METKKTYAEDIERILNNPERKGAIDAFHEKLQAKKQKKMLVDICVQASVALAFGLLGCAGLMALYVAFPFCGILGMYAAFRFGRWVERESDGRWN